MAFSAIILIISFSLFSTTLCGTDFHGPPTSNCNKTIDPTTDVVHGRMIDSYRSVLKLDCPGCPIYNSSWHTNTTALIYDLTVNSSMTPPRILLNGKPFSPPGEQLGWTPFTVHEVRPVPGNVSIDDYMDAPETFSTTQLVGMQDTVSIPNDLGFNITRIFFVTIAFGYFENRWGNVSYIDVYLMTTNEHRLSIEWWEIVPMTEFFKNNTDTSEPPFRLPEKLAEKLKKRKDASDTTQQRIPLFQMLWVLGILIVLIDLVALAVLYIWRRYRQDRTGGIYLEVNQDGKFP